MKKTIIYIITLLCFTSCVKSLTDYDVDQTKPTAVSPESLFSNALEKLADNITTPSVNINVFRFWVQQWTTTTYTDEPNYDIITRNIPLNFWNPFYREVLRDLKDSRLSVEADQLTGESIRNNKLAAIAIMEVYTWAAVVNTWGDVPYSQALSEDIGQAVYDDASGIYDDLFLKLDTAIAEIDVNADGFGSADFIYSNDMSAWLKLAHSLRMRLAITVADVNPDFARNIIEESAPLAFQSNADNAAFPYQTAVPYNNPVSNNLLNPTFTTRQDYIAASTLVNAMNDLNDPRRSSYFTTIGGAYVGGSIGGQNTFSANSTIAVAITQPTFEGLFLDYSEIEFIKAEAAERWAILGNAATFYNNAVTASCNYWGKTEEEITSYLAQPAVAYATAQGDYKEKIGVQKWIALYNRSMEAWTEWRRLDYPALAVSLVPTDPGVIPLRLTYITTESSTNGANVDAASARLTNGDAVNSRIFWDIN